MATAVAFVILVGLGVWQLQRLAWKEGLLAQIDTAEQAPPRTLGSSTPPLFTRVQVQGVLRGAPYALYGSEVEGDHLGAQLVEILDRQGAAPVVVVLGWVATDEGIPKPVTGPAAITGYVRLPETPNFLSAPDDPEGRRFYTLNPHSIGASLGVGDVAPFTLVALGGLPPAPRTPIPATGLPRPVNNHLNYALTWFGLAGALLVVFVSWAVRRA